MHSTATATGKVATAAQSGWEGGVLRFNSEGEQRGGGEAQKCVETIIGEGRRKRCSWRRRNVDANKEKNVSSPERANKAD